MTASNVFPLLPPGTILQLHQQYLAARAVTLAVAQAAGLHSVTARQGAAELGMANDLTSPGLSIPYPGVSPAYYRVRLDGGSDGVRFIAPAGREVPVYVPPQIARSDGGPLLVVEGPVKALALEAHGFEAVGLGGTGTTLTTGVERRLNTSWPIVTGRIVVVVFDSNRATNPNVARDEARLAMALERAGALPLVASVPHAPNGEPQGPDDYLMTGGATALQTIVAGALPGDPLVRVKSLGVLPPPALDQALTGLLADVPFLMSVLERGVSVRRPVSAAMEKLGVKPGDFRDALAEVKKLQKDAAFKARATPEVQVREPMYGAKDGRLWLIEQVREGEVLTPLTNFDARIMREIIVDDGVERKLLFEISGKTNEAVFLPTVDVTPDELSKGAWPIGKWGAMAITTPMVRAEAHLRAAIQVVSTPERALVFAHLGFRRIDGQLVFLHADGAVGAADIEVRVTEKLGRYSLPTKVVDPAGAVKVALRLRTVVSKGLGYLLLATIFRAPLQSVQYADTVVWLHGPSGAMKSTLAALVMAFYGPFDAEHLPGSWLSTPTALEELLFAAKDVAVVIDDFAPTSADVNDPMRKAAVQVIRSVGNHTSRSRAQRDLSLRPARPPRALVVSTGEDLPGGESILSRLFPVELRKGEVDLAALTKLQKDSARLPHAMAGFIEHVIANHDAIAAWAPKRFEEIRTRAQTQGAHLRSPAAVGHLQLGLEAFASFAESVGAFSPAQARTFVDEGFKALMQLAAQQRTHTAEANPAQRFLSVLRSLITQGRVLLLPRPLKSGSLGDWQDRKVAANCEALERPVGMPPARDAIGWLDTDEVLLDPEAAYRVVAEAMHTAGDPMPVKKPTLWARLRDMGVLTTDEPGHLTMKRMIGSRTLRVLVLPRTVLDEDDGSGPDTPPNSPGGSPPRGPTKPPPSAPVSRQAGTGTTAPTSGSEASKTGSSTPGSGGISKEMNSNNKQCQLDTYKQDPWLPGLPAARGEGAPIGRDSDDGAAPVALCGEEDVGGPSRLGAGGAEKSGRSGGSASRKPSTSQRNNVSPTAGTAAPAPRDEPQFPVLGALPIASIVGCSLVSGGASAPTLDAAGLAERMRAGESVTLAVGQTGAEPPSGRARMLFLRLPDATTHAVDLARSDGLGLLAEALSDVELVVDDASTAVAAMVDQLGVQPRAIFDVRIASALVHAGRYQPPRSSLPPFPALDDISVSLLDLGLTSVAKLFAVATSHREAIAREQMQKVAALEFAALPAILDMQRFGVRVDRERWTRLVEERASEVARLERELRVELGIKNLRSQEQLVPALRAKGFDVARTGKATLARFLPHPLIEKLVRYQQQAAFLADQGQSVLRALDRSPDGRVRAYLDPVGARTGRMTACEPNLLGLPRDPDVRGCFVPADGYVFVVADYATCELRAVADTTNDTNLREIFVRGGDPHRRTAGQLLGKRDEDVTDEERERAKPANFGAIYGITPHGLVESALKTYSMTLSIEAATALLDGFKKAYPNVTAWQQSMAQQMPETMRTAAGRVRRFGRGEGVEPRLNFPVQGVCADGIKHAIGLLDPQLARYGARLLLAIHDELLVEVPRDDAEVVKGLVVDCMRLGMTTFVTSVPIEVDADVRYTWARRDRR